MVTLHELSQEVVKIREAVNAMEVKGRQNAALIVYCCEKCDNIIKAINEAIVALSASNNQPREELTTENDPPEEEDEVNEQNSRIS